MTLHSEIVTSLQQKIRRSIPLSETMQFEIEQLSSHSITVMAPLAPNINIHGTGFAGSIYSLGILTGWALTTHIMSLTGMQASLVVARAEIKYRSPVTADIKCFASVSESASKEFYDNFKAGSNSPLQLCIDIGEEKNAQLTARFVAIKPASS
jgi:thioesterase domain-containing protein